MGLVNELTRRDAETLQVFLKQITDKRTYVRGLTLCLLAEGYTIRWVTENLNVNRREVYRWLHTYLNGRDPYSLHDRPRSGRPRVAPELTDKRILSALAKDPRKQGFLHNAWTVATLAQYLNDRYGTQVSAATLRRRMHAIGLRYKLPKYVYEEKEPNRAQKKGLLPVNSPSNAQTR